jgi:protein phosphatase
MLSAFGATDPGPRRKVNEDAFVCDVEHGLFVVADGMGGHSAGEVASKVAVDAVCVFLARTRDGEKVTWPYGIDPTLSFDANRVATAIKLANRRVFKVSETGEHYTGMGTTVVVALFNEGRIVFSSVGDSRLYSYRDGALTQLTQDDSWVTMLLAKGALDPAAAARHPMKHVLTSVLGGRDQLECKVHERELSGSETFLLSTDGLHGALDAASIERVLQSNGTPAALAQRLIEQALERGSSDNVTAVVVRHEA